MARSLAEMIILISISLVAAFVFNNFNPQGIPLFGQWDPSNGVVNAGGPCAPIVNQTNDIDTMDFYLRSEAVFVDARSRSDFGEGHIPRSVNFPVGEQDALIGEFLEKFTPDTRILVYCSGPDCQDSTDLAKFLKDYGYKNVSVYYHGFSGWKNAGRPVEIMETSVNE